MHKIDIHTHILPKDWPDLREKYGYGGFVQIEHCSNCIANLHIDGKFFRQVQDNCWDPEVRIKDCNKFNIDKQVLSTVPVMFNYWAKPEHTLDLSQYLNDHIAGVVNRYPDRFLGLGTVPLQSPQLAIQELTRCVKELKLSGVQIGSHVNDWNLSQPELFDFFAAASELKAAIFVHPWDMMGKDRMPQYWLPWLVGMPAEVSLAICSLIFGGVFKRLPDLKIAFAHGGGAFPFTLGRIAHGFNVRPDLCAVDNDIHPEEFINQIYVDALVHDAMSLKFLLEKFGPQQIALGTDYPFPLGELEPGKLIADLNLSQEITKRLYHGTALEWLNLS